MIYESTRDSKLTATASAAIVAGICADGGLYVPHDIPRLEKAQLQELLSLPYRRLCARLLSLWLDDFSEAELAALADRAYASFDCDSVAPLRALDSGLYCCELWHGPTSAFKDVALQLLPLLMAAAKTRLDDRRTTLIAVATSGDTGKAALQGFCGVAGTRIAVFYPHGGVSEAQRLQMSTQSGDNVLVCAVNGNFDDAQTGVKRIFADAQLKAELARAGVELSSANSINLGRLVPQIVYYFSSYAQLCAQRAIGCGDEVDFCVPSGNFGDILAGWYAKQMGLPVGRLICASNSNNVLSDFIAGGRYDARRNFYRTMSPSMDILVSSNVERLMRHICGERRTAKLYAEFAATHTFALSDGETAALRADFDADWCSESQTAESMRAAFADSGYLCDPHTGVALFCARRRRGERPMVVMSTASPYKFSRSVLKAVFAKEQQSEQRALEQLEQLSGTAAPPALKGLWQQRERFTQVCECAQMGAQLLGFVKGAAEE